MENLYEGAPDFIEGLLKADPKERMTWEEFFSHSWLDLGSRLVRKKGFFWGGGGGKERGVVFFLFGE